MSCERERVATMNKKRVLLVDDDTASLVLGKEVLGRAGFDVSTAQSAEEALSVVAGGELDVVLMDVSLPGMDGLTAIEHIKDGPHADGLVVLCLTADPAKHALSALECGADGCLGKPYNIHKIADDVLAFCKKPH